MTNTELVEQEIDIILENKHFGKNFEFRKGQRKIITDVCVAYLDYEKGEGPDSIILAAPTGSGKSVLALFSSAVLSHFKKKGYILTSELSLQDQYENDLNRFNLSAGMVKGVDNYRCHLNHEPFSLGECRIRNISPAKMPCVDDCEYIQKRNTAAESSIAVLGYAYWLIYRNYVAQKQDKVLFEKRDFVFFDESHNINRIVQNHLSPTLTEGFFENLEHLQKFLVKQKFVHAQITDMRILNKLLRQLKNSNVGDDINELLIELEYVLMSFGGYTDKVKARAKAKFPQDKTYTNVNQMPKNWTSAMKKLDWVKDVHCKIQDYNTIVKEKGTDNIVKKEEEKRTVLNFIDESYLVKKHLIKESGFKVYMSATIGDPREYMKNSGIENAKYINAGNTFNFENSPIYFLKGFKMNFNNKDEMVPKLTQYMDILLSTVEKKTKGIIHTSSYQIADMIESNSKHSGRLITYKGSTEKKSALALFEQSDDGILMGPSLLEGLDLKDDQSRFQVFFKVPYSSLGDPLVKAKLNKSQTWYNYDTTVKILQGIGRSIRSENDWARTYLMDANFIRVMKSQKLPEHIESRYRSLNLLLKEILEKSRQKS